MTTVNSSYYYGVYHPEQLIDILRAGAFFPANQVFQLPPLGSTETLLKSFIKESFPAISEERHEVWLRFRHERPDKSCYAIEDIESAHFFSSFRHEAAPSELKYVLRSYSIPITAPIEDLAADLIAVYETIVREHVAKTIIKAWFGSELQISQQFISQLKVGYSHQQSSSPEMLEPMPSDDIWARMVAYNPGLRKFEEKPRVLPLQDIQEVLKRTDQEFRDKLKTISEKHSKKFPDIIQEAEDKIATGTILSKWLVQERSKPGTYIYDLDEFLSQSGGQESFLYSAILYLYWRQEVLNKDYNGRLMDCPVIKSYLINAPKNSMRQSVAEALFTIIYAGGPRIFQKALIEARQRILKVVDEEKVDEPVKEVLKPKKEEEITFRSKPMFLIIVKLFIKSFKTIYYKGSDKEKKKFQQEVKKVGLNIKKVETGNFDEDQYGKLCEIFGIPIQEFEKTGATSTEAKVLPKVIEQELNFSASIPKDDMPDIAEEKDESKIEE